MQKLIVFPSLYITEGVLSFSFKFLEYIGVIQYFLEVSSLKLLSTIFYQIFVFSPNDGFKIYEKCLLLHLKSSFRSRDIQIFAFLTFLSTLSRLKRTNGSGIIYDVMNWLA